MNPAATESIYPCPTSAAAHVMDQLLLHTVTGAPRVLATREALELLATACTTGLAWGCLALSASKVVAARVPKSAARTSATLTSFAVAGGGVIIVARLIDLTLPMRVDGYGTLRASEILRDAALGAFAASVLTRIS